MLSNIKNIYTRNPKEFIYRVISTLLSLTIVPNLIIFIFLSYMSYNDFFSYDFFINGLFGMKIFFMVTFFFVILSSGLMFGSIILLYWKKVKPESYKEAKANYLLALTLLLNISWIFLYIGFYSINYIPLSVLLGTMILSFTICAYIIVLIFHSAKIQIFAFMFLTLVLVCLSTAFPQTLSTYISYGLRAFGTGHVNIDINMKNNEEIKNSRLTLLTPNFIYTRDQNQSKKGVTIYPISSVESMKIYR